MCSSCAPSKITFTPPWICEKIGPGYHVGGRPVCLPRAATQGRPYESLSRQAPRTPTPERFFLCGLCVLCGKTLLALAPLAYFARNSFLHSVSSASLMKIADHRENPPACSPPPFAKGLLGDLPALICRTVGSFSSAVLCLRHMNYSVVNPAFLIWLRRSRESVSS